ncbi:restriction endonuclease subunit S [Sulfitobacter sp.]|uniref:restriction endonuclease subunit S n=1 Tax=Sulfitobacter sp. TaxID=1903071 RepID=UPI003562CE42
MTQTHKQNVPKLRFPGFEGNWAHSRLGMLGTFKSGVGFSEVEQGGTNGVPFYKVSDMNLPGNEAVMTTANNYVTVDQISRLKFKPIRERAVIFAKVGAAIFLERKRRAENFLLDNNMMAFIPRETIADEYLSHLFSNIRLSKFAQVGALPSYNSSDLATIKLHLPTLPEQRKIASFLSAVDTKIAQLSRKKALFEDYKKGCMQQLFSQKIRFKDDDGNDFPDWEEKRLGEVFERVRQKNSVRNENVLTISAQNGLVSQLDYFNHSVAAKDTSGYYLLEKGDFAYNKSYSKGYPMGAIKRLKFYERGIVSTLYICFRSKISGAEDFFECYFNSGFQNRWLAKISQEGARNHGLLNMAIEDVFDMPLPYPHPAEQRKIADFLSALDRKIDLVAQELTHARNFKAGLLQQMFV